MPGKSVKDFSLPSTGDTFRLSALRGSTVVLYFYPKDSTPGCTRSSSTRMEPSRANGAG